MPPPSAADDGLPPVPDDLPAPGSTQLPWSQIPKFTPGITNVQEYAQKLKFLASLWPVEFLDQLAPRAALMVEGTAFKKIAKISPQKLKVKSQDGVAAIVEAIGGSWGSTEMEERYEYFEKSLYGTIQRSDESNDSFLSRMEANFVELLSRNTTLEEVQAYVLLRQSTLPAEDKKRILLEHEGELKYKPVVKSFRLLGSRFFHEFQSGRSSQKTKVYDVNLSEPSDGHDGSASHESGPVERAYHTYNMEEYEPELDQEYIDALVSQEDADALTVSTFEGEFEEFLQETPEMYEALTSYIEARSKLVEKRRSRGFWPIKGKGKFGKNKGKGSGKRSSKERDLLLQRIARSHCRRCGALGHWKVECPLGNERDKPSGSSNAASANVVFTERPREVLLASVSADEVFSEEDHDGVVLDPSLHPCFSEECFMVGLSDRNRQIAKLSDRMSRVNKLRMSNHAYGKSVSPAVLSKSPRMRREDETVSVRRFQHVIQPFGNLKTSEQVYSSLESFGTHAILDTGASRCIIGEKTLDRLKQALPQQLCDQFQRKASQVKFRFGNNQSLTSIFAVQIPLKHVDSRRLWISVEVVPGHTPFLFSKKAFKLLQGSLDSCNDLCWMPRVQDKPIPLATSPTGLYLIDLLDICPTVASEQIMFHEEPSEVLSHHTKGNHHNGDKIKKFIHVKVKPEVEGENQFLSSPNALKKICPTMRNFRSRKSDSAVTSRPVIVSNNATHGRNVEDHRRGLDSPVDAAASDFRASVGEARVGQRAGARCHDPRSVVRDDGPNSAAKSLTGESQGGYDPCQGDVPEESSSLGCPKPSSHDGELHAIDSNDARQLGFSAIKGAIGGFPFLGGDRGGRRDRGARADHSGTISYQSNPGSGATCTTLPLPGNLSLEEWGTNVINFGKKHKGKTYVSVMQRDPGYLTWSLSRYHSLMPEHQDFVRYGQLWMREIGNDL